MSFALSLTLIVVGVVILLLGGDYLIRGAAALARRWKIPALVVGLTIVAFGTSAPELVVSINAALQGVPGLALGNIVGSNIANVLLVLGLPAIFAPIGASAPGVKRNALIGIISGIVLIAVAWDGRISLLDGCILFSLIVGYIVFLATIAMRRPDDPDIAELTDVDEMPGLPKSVPSILFALAIGLVALPAGAHLIVMGGENAALALNIDPVIIGLTALAFGTSLPELATVVIAAMRREADIAIGNILGSNIFNIFAVGGATGIAAGLFGRDLPTPEQFLSFDFWVMLGASILLLGVVFAMKRIGRLTGGLLFLGYAAYIAALVWMTVQAS